MGYLGGSGEKRVISIKDQSPQITHKLKKDILVPEFYKEVALI